jgi:hypothetical protein
VFCGTWFISIFLINFLVVQTCFNDCPDPKGFENRFELGSCAWTERHLILLVPSCTPETVTRRASWRLLSLTLWSEPDFYIHTSWTQSLPLRIFTNSSFLILGVFFPFINVIKVKLHPRVKRQGILEPSK